MISIFDARQYTHPEKIAGDYLGESSRNLILLLGESQHDLDLEELNCSAVLLQPTDAERLYNTLHSYQTSTFDKEIAASEPALERDYPLQIGDILIADDNRINQQVTRSVLEQDGHHVTVVDDGEGALELLESKHFDLAIVDMMMPGLGGLDVIRRYRGLKGGHDQMLFMVLTANVSEEARGLCRSLGVRYLSKPLHGKTLQQTVQEILKQGEYKRIAG